MTGWRRAVAAFWPFLLSLVLSCRKSEPAPPAEPAPADAAPLGSVARPPSPRKGMVWIPRGALVAGTPPDALPRIADEEMPGAQVILHGFYIDVFQYPNEEGAIPVTNVTQAEAQTLCGERGKRLCTELEWERACKGADNRPYPYGERYRAERCETGADPSLVPSGLRYGCVSDFGVHDTHGGAWEWTASAWGRGVDGNLVTMRGGNARAGELVGRCANATGRPPDRKSPTTGLRCCAGDPNPAEVVLHVTHGPKLEPKEAIDKKLAAAVAESLTEDAKTEIFGGRDGKLDRMWLWHPIGNETLVVFGGCSGLGTKPACGIVVVRVVLDRPRLLGVSTSGHWAPTIHADMDARDVWLFGGDDQGSFRRLVAYVWGRVSVAEKERRVGKPAKGKKK